MKQVFTTLFSTVFLAVLFFSNTQAQELSRSNVSGLNNYCVKQVTGIRYNETISPRGTIYFEEGWESNSFATNGWVTTDADGDAQNWFISKTLTPHSGSYTAGSASWNQNALTPNNWMATKAIDLTNATGTIILEYWVRAQDQVWPSEYYGVFASKSGNKPADFTGANGKELFKEKMVKGSDATNNLYVKRTIDISSYIGSQVYLAFRHYNCSDWFVLDIDDISVYESSTIDAGITGVVSPNNNNTCSLQSEEAVTVTLFNYGGVKLTNFPVKYKFNGVEVVDTFKAELLPASSMNFTFAKKAAFTDLGYFTMDFSVNVAGDTKADNNSFSYKISNTDANIKVEVSSDAAGGQGWEIISSDSTVIASHGAYQWNIKETTSVCVKANDCYTFKWYGGTKNTVKVYYNDELINTKTATKNYNLYSIGASCLPVNLIYLDHNVPNYGVVGNGNIGGSFLNIGREKITNFKVQYIVNGDSSIIETLNNQNIESGDTFYFAHSVPYNFDKVGKYSISIKIFDFNGTFTPQLNTLNQYHYTLSFKPTTRVLGEEATGTWCGWCVRGHVFMEYMDEHYADSWVGVAVHNGDPMVVSTYDTGIGNFIGGYPSGLINRYEFVSGFDIDPSDFEVAHKVFKEQVVPANMKITSATYNATSRKLQYTVEMNFAGAIDKDFNVLGIITENDVKGTDAGYNQTNYYADNANGVMGGYEILPNPVPAAQMVYQNVARALIGGWNGTASVIPNPTVDNGKYTYSFSYTHPQTEKVQNMNLIAVILDKKTGEVVNVVKRSYSNTVGFENVLPELVDYKIYPNPASDIINIDFNLPQKELISIFVTDITGRRIMNIMENEEIQNFSKSININPLNKGIYLVNVQSKNGISVQKFIKE